MNRKLNKNIGCIQQYCKIYSTAISLLSSVAAVQLLHVLNYYLLAYLLTHL